jgi:alpha-L-arabinofuranosidase
MNHSIWRLFFLATIVVAIFFSDRNLFGQATLTVDASRPGHAVSPLLWGVFFEDINLSADGGIYPELVRNRSFEDAEQPENWKISGADAAIDDHKPLNPYNRRSLRVKADGAFTIENDGYWGMNVVSGDDYTFKLAARAADGFTGPLTVKILSSTGAELAAGEISGLTADWNYHTLNLTASAGDPKARLEISGSGQGTLFLDMVSLMPKKTWKDHGLRPDLAESLAALHPSFMRFPGGCWVEGDDFAHMNHWKNTIGDIDVRTPLWNIWGYYATHGLGYYEYLQLAEDLGAEPLFDINVGMSHHETVPLDRMDQWVQDALDAVEFANGPTNSVWGARRAKMGHPAPFNLKLMEIGNENGGPDYLERWPLLVNALREKYPYLQFIVNTDLRGRPYPTNPAPDIVDEHYYESADSFIRRAGQYDSYDRHGPKIFVGEYAVTENAGQGNLRAAVGEAAFMTGMERNSDVVLMASYAPLLVNLNHRAWNPDLINFDSSHWYGLPGYYVQKMFSENRGDVTLPVDVDAPAVDGGARSGAIGVGTWKTQAEFKDVKVTAPDGSILFQSDFSQNADGWKQLGNGGEWKVQDGAFRQVSDRENIRAIAGDKSWTDYTLTLKARKISGDEGFLILFRLNDENSKCWWNLGGWGNSANAVELDDNVITRTPGSIETGRWYDIRIAVKGNHIQCWLDGRLVHELDYQPVKSLVASATRDSQSGDIIVKVVNVADRPMATDIAVRGGNQLRGTAQAIVLTSASPTDENSLSQPLKVAPQTESLTLQGATMHETFPGNSVTVLRIGTK